MPTPEQEHERRIQLGKLLVERRMALGRRFYGRKPFAEAKGLTHRTVLEIENAAPSDAGGERQFRAGTLAAFEVAYELAPGAILRFLDCETDQLELADNNTPSPPPPDRTGADEELLANLTEEQRQQVRGLVELLKRGNERSVAS